MKFHICKKCHTKGVIPEYHALLSMKSEDGVWLCGLCENRVGDDRPFYLVDVKIRRICKHVYSVMPLTVPYILRLSHL